MPHLETKIQDNDNNKISNNNPHFLQLSSFYVPRNRNTVKERWKQKHARNRKLVQIFVKRIH